jgi:hypothetical protein
MMFLSSYISFLIFCLDVLQAMKRIKFILLITMICLITMHCLSPLSYVTFCFALFYHSAVWHIYFYWLSFFIWLVIFFGSWYDVWFLKLKLRYFWYNALLLGILLKPFMVGFFWHGSIRGGRVQGTASLLSDERSLGSFLRIQLTSNIGGLLSTTGRNGSYNSPWGLHEHFPAGRSRRTSGGHFYYTPLRG